MSIELIIFDLDGTIVDTCEDITNALNFCLKNYGISGFTKDEVQKMIGEGVRKFIEKALAQRDLSNSLLEDMLDCFVNYYSEHISDSTRPYPGVVETLERLIGINKAVISNKLTSLSMKTLSNLGLINYFDFVAGNDFFPEQKPSPLPILKTLEKFNKKKENVLILGDSILDIEAGKSAGVKTVAVTYGYGDKELLKYADFIIDRFEELLKIIRDIKK
ncbi:MAG: HAD-IA family hydrolase [Thermodesulfovibrio sp.]|nr:HAD-IA family hydrolase [Thermodesulfovibrio sp.]